MNDALRFPFHLVLIMGPFDIEMVLSCSLTFFLCLYHTLTTSCLDLSLFTLQCMGPRKSVVSPASPTLSEASSYRSIATDSTTLSPYVISDWERTTYYHGISPDHRNLLYRSDPFHPQGQTRTPSSSSSYQDRLLEYSTRRSTLCRSPDLSALEK